jgi:hypothetical protein
MKKTTTITILGILFFTTIDRTQGQSCSNDALTAKYWQYKKTFNEHFIVIDRKPEGCIGNGLTENEAEIDSLNCSTPLSHGLSLPATSNIITPDGYAALGDNERGWLQDDTVGAIG